MNYNELSLPNSGTASSNRAWGMDVFSLIGTGKTFLTLN